MCVHMHAHTQIWVTISSKHHRLSLSEGVIQTLNPFYDKEAAGTLELLLTWLSTESFSRFYEQREKL